MTHIENIRANRFLAGAHILFIPENNTAFSTVNMAEVVEQFARVSCLYEDKGRKKASRNDPEAIHRRPGIVTSKCTAF